MYLTSDQLFLKVSGDIKYVRQIFVKECVFPSDEVPQQHAECLGQVTDVTIRRGRKLLRTPKRLLVFLYVIP